MSRAIDEFWEEVQPLLRLNDQSDDSECVTRPVSWWREQLGGVHDQRHWDRLRLLSTRWWC